MLLIPHHLFVSFFLYCGDIDFILFQKFRAFQRLGSAKLLRKEEDISDVLK